MATLDTLQDAVNSLTASTTTLVNEVQVKKATLDASVADAESARDAAAASATTASGHATSAAASAAAAASTASGIAGFDLDAIAASKAVTAVDVFVYDTSKDSDGGAWRKRTQHTSWYNETLNTATRGSRKDFPAVAVIVAEAAKVTIYDGDDPALPMWMVFTGSKFPETAASALKAIAALNGVLAIGTAPYDYFQANFISETMIELRDGTGLGFSWPSGISGRNTIGKASNPSLPGIVNRAVNDVAMTVLPDAPIDPATGLPVPTIAVATAGGVSVIKDDGAVVDSNDIINAQRITFDDKSLLVWYNSAKVALVYDTYDSDGFVFSEDYDENGTLNIFVNSSTQPTGKVDAVAKNEIVLGLTDTTTDSGLHLIKRGAIAAHVTSTYNTGWMNGDIKGAFLSSTDATSLVGSGELVTNGTFDTDTSGWTLTETGTGTATWDSGTASLKLTRDDLSNRGTASQTVSGTSGSPYLLTFDILSASDGNVAVAVNGVSSPVFSPNQKAFYMFTSDGSDLIEFLPQTNGGTSVYIDNVSVKLADADRSVNNKGLIVNGTVTRSPVATGAELVAYSGFSASNYLEQPYNSALDFGTGDFCVMGWFDGAGAASGGSGRTLVARRDPAGSGNWWELLLLNQGSNGELAFSTNSGVSLVTSNTTHSVGSWGMVAVVRNGGTLSLYFNGVLKESVSNNHDLTNSNGEITVGVRNDTGSLLTPLTDGSLALFRISATAPTAEQIKKIYEDEKVLFQENAKAVLAGTSDAVTAMAYDDATSELLVGTSQYTSIFRGLRRIGEISGSASAISASNGLRVIED